ncbi:MAG TPA: hypothetical protein VFV00_01435 [Acidimicrobiales bacterium]|nr:hypothetical protein [Acidimicrobiales bacterium]
MKVRLLLALLLGVGCLIGVARPAHAEAGDPIGSFDSTSVRWSGVYYYGLSSWEIYGWAADPDAPGASLDVHVYIDGQKQGVIQTGDPRPDVAAVYPFAGENSGWDTGITAASNQPHTACAYAINVGPGANNTTLGCVDLPAQGPQPGDPVGNLEAVTAPAGLLRFQGWAGDPDTNVVDPSEVRPYIDGQPYTAFPADQQRPDVHQALPAIGNAGGFDATIAALPGRHLYCVDIDNAGTRGGTNTSLGCGVIDVPGAVGPNVANGGGSWDSQTNTAATSGAGNPSTTYDGWAWDPDTNGPATVRVRAIAMNNFYTGFQNTQSVSDFQTGEPRPDVQAAYPSAPPNSGFSRTEVHYYNPHTPQELFRCFYVVESAGERLISCAPLETHNN